MTSYLGSKLDFKVNIADTADPSASLGMTKERVAVTWKVVAGPQGVSHHLGWAAGP
jgi:hypothetical protein